MMQQLLLSTKFYKLSTFQLQQQQLHGSSTSVLNLPEIEFLIRTKQENNMEKIKLIFFCSR